MKIFQIDAFTNEIFKGNPAAVVPLKTPLSNEKMQAIAQENNLSETAFFYPTEAGFHLQWFTPVTEVELCGHATLAAAHVIWNHLNYEKSEICFHTLSGDLLIQKKGKEIQMSFPTQKPEQVHNHPSFLIEAMNIKPKAIYKGLWDYMLIYDNQDDIKKLKPNFGLLAHPEVRGVIATSPGFEKDFVSRFFCPSVGINEDPVTGSAHTLLAPYWAEKLGKTTLIASQISKRHGNLKCEIINNKVQISGQAVTYMQGEITSAF